MSCFPKVNACTPVYADELNYMYDPYDIKASMLENAVNVAKLQYCASVTDIDHDYMVVDVFTDSTGRFDTVNVCNNTCCFSNYFDTTCTCCSLVCCSFTSGTYTITHSVCTANGILHNCIYACTGNSSSDYASPFVCLAGCIFPKDCIDLSTINYFKYNVCLYQNSFYNSGGNNHCSCSCLNIVWDYGNWACYLCQNTNGSAAASRNTIMEYYKIRENYWRVYKDNSCLCDINLCNISQLPKVCMQTNWIMNKAIWYNGAVTTCAYVCYGLFCFVDKLGTTSTYCGNALTGNYINYASTQVYPTSCLYSATPACAVFSGDYCLRTLGTSSFTATGCLCQTNNVFNISCDLINFDICTNILAVAGIGTVCAMFENFSYCKSNSWSDYNENIKIRLCKVCSCCFNLYCNSICACSITLTGNIYVCLYAHSGSTVSGNINSCICIGNSCINEINRETRIVTVPLEYTNPILTTYLKTDHLGDGTITYNVYDATTDTLIGDNLTPNQTHTLDSAVDCAYYEIIQCSDGVSCIKSYALLAGGQ
jgi:hypothetical protein